MPAQVASQLVCGSFVWLLCVAPLCGSSCFLSFRPAAASLTPRRGWAVIYDRDQRHSPGLSLITQVLSLRTVAVNAWVAAERDVGGRECSLLLLLGLAVRNSVQYRQILGPCAGM